MKLRQSHIVPEFCYGKMYDKKHRLIEAEIAKGGIKRRYLQKGYYEPLLCERCEQVINSYEDAFHRYWYQPGVLPERVASDHVVLHGADYRTMKLFHLSIIWRAGVSKGFSAPRLGPYSDKIRQMLLDGEPGPDDHLPVLGWLLLDDDGQIVHSLVTTPLVARFEGSHIYSMCYAGCEWLLLMTDHPTPNQKFMSFRLRGNGNMVLMTCHYLFARITDYSIQELRKSKRASHPSA